MLIISANLTWAVYDELIFTKLNLTLLKLVTKGSIETISIGYINTKKD